MTDANVIHILFHFAAVCPCVFLLRFCDRRPALLHRVILLQCTFQRSSGVVSETDKIEIMSCNINL